MFNSRRPQTLGTVKVQRQPAHLDYISGDEWQCPPFKMQDFTDIPTAVFVNMPDPEGLGATRGGSLFRVLEIVVPR